MRATVVAALLSVAAAAPYIEPSSPPSYETTPSDEGYPVPSSTPEGYPVPTPSDEGYPVPTPSDEGYPVPTPSDEGYPVPTPSDEGYPVPTMPKESYPMSKPYVTKTVYSTSLYTITSCEEYVTDCPADYTKVVTTEVPAYTTVCPEDEVPTYVPMSKPYVTKTVYSTSLYTMTSCEEHVTDCPADYSKVVSTEVPVYTTVCPEDEVPKPYVTKTVYSTSLTTLTSCEDQVTDCPADYSKVVSTKVPAYTTVCPEDEVPTYTETPCPSDSTVVVTLPSGTEGPYYPTVSGGVTYYHSGVASTSGSYAKPTYPAEFTGAASHAQVGGFAAGVGALVALFL